MSILATNTICPCGSGKKYLACCGLYIDTGQHAPTAEALMRSRFSAYCYQKTDYLLNTWHSTQRPERLNFDPKVKWSRLKILATQAGQVDDTHGQVHFRAYYKINGKGERLEENSQFIRENGQWFYQHGQIK